MALWGNTDNAGSKPKFVAQDANGTIGGTAGVAITYGVDAVEETVASNKAKGMQHAGWVRRLSYTDAQGNVRNKTETLVAMGSITGDALDDAVVADA
jgi:hypothetical protein